MGEMKFASPKSIPFSYDASTTHSGLPSDNMMETSGDSASFQMFETTGEISEPSSFTEPNDQYDASPAVLSLLESYRRMISTAQFWICGRDAEALKSSAWSSTS